MDTDNKQLPADATELRRLAEELLRENTTDLPPATDVQLQRIIHENAVLQIEVEMQNEELRRARDELETVLGLYSDLYDFAPVGFFTLDRNGIIKALNLTGSSLLGIERSQLIGRRFIQYIPIDETTLFNSFQNSLFTTPGRQHCETLLRKKGASPIVIQVEAHVDAGQQECRIAVIDINERKLTELKQRESEERFRSLFEHSLDAVLLTVPDGTIIDANPSACDIFGMTVQELCRVGRAGIMDVSDPRLAPALKERETTGRIFTELTCVRSNGERFPAEVSSVVVSDRPPRSFVIIRDISKRKRAEEILIDSEERYHQLFEMVQDSVVMLDIGKMQFIDVNAAAIRMYGYTKEELMLLNPSELSAEPVKTVESIRKREEFVALHLHRKKDGTVFPVEITGSFFEYHGRMVKVATIRDITERAHAKEMMINLNQKLLALNEYLLTVQEEERLSISRNIHDDLGQILTVLKLDLELIELRMPADNNELNETFSSMRQRIDLVTTVIQRIAADLRPPLLDNLGLTAAIEWHIKDIGKHCGIEFCLELDEDLDSIGQKASTVVMRIIQEGVTNIIRHARASKATISLCTRGKKLILNITDNGDGITPDQMASTQAYGLMGMQERARTCRGTLEISGSPGCGTNLQLTIPLKKGAD